MMAWQHSEWVFEQVIVHYLSLFKGHGCDLLSNQISANFLTYHWNWAKSTLILLTLVQSLLSLPTSFLFPILYYPSDHACVSLPCFFLFSYSLCCSSCKPALQLPQQRFLIAEDFPLRTPLTVWCAGTCSSLRVYANASLNSDFFIILIGNKVSTQWGLCSLSSPASSLRFDKPSLTLLLSPTI